MNEGAIIQSVQNLVTASNQNAIAINQHAGFVAAVGFAIIEILKELRSVPGFDSQKIETLLKETADKSIDELRIGNADVNRQYKKGLSLIVDELTKKN